LAEIDGLFVDYIVDNIFLYKAFFLEIDVSKPLVNQGLWKERVSFLEANLWGACWSRMLLTLCTRYWKKPNTTVRSSLQATMVVVSQHF